MLLRLGDLAGTVRSDIHDRASANRDQGIGGTQDEPLSPIETGFARKVHLSPGFCVRLNKAPETAFRFERSREKVRSQPRLPGKRRSFHKIKSDVHRT